ncbi:MAG TPA: tRNA pseudouridine(13) synthase TruD [Candidatus Bathyarchaeia archaeon]|nr:tRNA pseudouridine(13) synthase TruD [Candidatus Bathyarchaeia archaeon]
MEVPETEKNLGISVYATKTSGIGGAIRRRPGDFVVEEVLTNGAKASVAPVGYPSQLGRYLVCVLVKEDWDTLLAVRAIAQKLGISQERIGIAGLKDTKALTAQHISLYGVRPKEISRLSFKNITVHPLCYADEKISTKLLFGNQFTTIIRSISLEQSDVKKLIDTTQSQLLALGGAPNFFGHQRFGTVRPITHSVGRAIVEEDLERATSIFLASSSKHEHPAAREARERLTVSKDFHEALNSFPAHLKYERLVLRRLVLYEKDFLGAVRELPLRLRKLFVQAFQSYLFNRFLSERISQGIQLKEARIGDFVVPLDENGLPQKNDDTVTQNLLSKINKTIEERKACVAIPLVGFKQPLSKGLQGEIEQKILEEENVKPKDFQISTMHEVSAPGGLRAVLTPIIDFAADTPMNDSENPLKNQVRLRFALRKGSYATMPLREFMKPDNVIGAGF